MSVHKSVFENIKLALDRNGEISNSSEIFNPNKVSDLNKNVSIGSTKVSWGCEKICRA